MRLDAGDTGRATCTAVKWRGVVPNAFETCTRIAEPPSERCTIWRSVALCKLSGGTALFGSGICCEAAHEPTQVVEASAGDELAETGVCARALRRKISRKVKELFMCTDVVMHFSGSTAGSACGR